MEGIKEVLRDFRGSYHKVKEQLIESIMLRHQKRAFQRENHERWQMAEVQGPRGDKTLDGFVMSTHTGGGKTISVVF